MYAGISICLPIAFYFQVAKRKDCEITYISSMEESENEVEQALRKFRYPMSQLRVSMNLFLQFTFR